MSEELNQVIEASLKKWGQGEALIQRLLDVARPSAVFGAPVSDGGRTIITASEVSAGMGFGFGIGGMGGGDDESDEQPPGPARPWGSCCANSETCPSACCASIGSPSGRRKLP